MIGSVLRIRYEVLEEMEETPIFAAFKAKDRVQVREVIVRVLQSPFAQESQFVHALNHVVGRVSQVSHPGLERLIGMDDHEGQPFLVSEFSAGQPLSDRIKKLAPFSAPVAVSMGISIAEALEILHQSGIVHGDVSSRNVMVASDGNTKLMLPGMWESYSSSKTAGAVMLPLMAPYLAPEVTADGMPSAATDVYSLGVLLFELLAGRPPYSGDTSVSIAMKHSTAPVPSIRAINASVPVALEEVVKKALAKSPADRYRNATELLADLRRIQDALRFGKPLHWPLQPEQEPSPDELRVAPKMSAVPKEVKQPKRRRPEENVAYEGDVPRWLMAIVYAALSIAVVIIGIWIYGNINKPKLLKVPNIVGKNVNEANGVLTEMGLGLRISKRQPTEKYPEETVIDTNPAVGAEVREHSHVSVVVSSGSKFVEVPDLRGMTLDDAKALLAKLGMSTDSAPRIVRDRHIESGKIVAQVPEARTKVQRGSNVRLQISGGADFRDNRAVVEPANNTYHLKITVPAKGEDQILIRVDMMDDNGTRTVHEEAHAPGETVELDADGAGDDVQFKIFFDNELVKQVKGKPEPKSNPEAGAETP